LSHPPLNNNLSIINVKLDNEVFTPDDKILIDVYIKNNGTNYQKQSIKNLINEYCD